MLIVGVLGLLSIIFLVLAFSYESLILWGIGIFFPVWGIISVLEFILKKLVPTSSMSKTLWEINWFVLYTLVLASFPYNKFPLLS